MLPLTSLSLDGRIYGVTRLQEPSDPQAKLEAVVSDVRSSPRVAALYEHDRKTGARLTAAAMLASQLEMTEVFSQFADLTTTEIADTTYHVWMERRLVGLSLEELMRDSSKKLSVTDLQQLVVDLTEALALLRRRGLSHGAISTRSLILTEPPAGTMAPRYRFRLSGLSLLSEGGTEVDDLATLKVLATVFNVLRRGSSIALEARAYLSRLGDYIVRAANDLGPANQVGLESLRNLADSKSSLETAKMAREEASLSNPFDFLSTEHLNNEGLVYRLFARSCPWVEDVSRPVPMLIEGPRGCGKSMVLRWLSLRTQLAGPDPVPSLESMEIAGFYIACASEVQSRVTRFKDPELASSHRQELIHYLNMVILREVANTLVELSKMSEESWGVTDSAGHALWTFVTTEVHAPVVPAAGVSIWEQIRDVAHVQLDRAHEALDGRTGTVRFTVGSFAHDLARTLTERIPFFARRRIAYCLDDYSSHRIPEAVQAVFNEVVFTVRSGNHIFKISAENRGFHPFTMSGARIDVQRELVSIDCGSFYLDAAEGDRKRVKQFSRDLLANRLEAAGWRGTPEQLIGQTQQSGVDFARRARDGKNPIYDGLDCIADLCTGDIAHLILLYKNVFDAGRVTATRTDRIPSATQNDAIIETSRYLLELVRSHVPEGARMSALIEQFGELSRWAMVSAPMIANHDKLEPRMQTRIEVDGLGISDPMNRDVGEDKFLTELLRRAVFVELRSGVSRRGIHRGEGVNRRVSSRLALRRIYLPAYGLSLSKNMAWKWSSSQFAEFLKTPEPFARKQIANVRKRALRADPGVLDGLEDLS